MKKVGEYICVSKKEERILRMEYLKEILEKGDRTIFTEKHVGQNKIVLSLFVSTKAGRIQKINENVLKVLLKKDLKRAGLTIKNEDGNLVVGGKNAVNGDWMTVYELSFVLYGNHHNISWLPLD